LAGGAKIRIIAEAGADREVVRTEETVQE